MRALAHVPLLRAGQVITARGQRQLLFGERAEPSDVLATRDMVRGTRLSALGAYYGALTRHDEAAALAELAGVPTRVLVGERDRLTPVAHSRRLGDLLPDAELVVLPRRRAHARLRGTRRHHRAPVRTGRGGAMSVHDAVVVGSGFGGLAAAIELRRTGLADVVLLEKADDLGGTWRDNRYPGCACDVPSHLYSFSFAPSAQWSRAFAEQPEIWDYLRRVADDFGVAERIRYGEELVEALYDDGIWRLTTGRGTKLEARSLVLATGALQRAVPAVHRGPGLLWRQRLPHRELAGRRHRSHRRPAGRGDRHRGQRHPGRAAAGTARGAPDRAAADAAVDPAQGRPGDRTARAATGSSGSRPELARARRGLLAQRVPGDGLHVASRAS